MSDQEAVLDIQGLSVDYGVGADAVHAVVDVSLRLARGEVLGLAGESGSGKSTLAYAVTRLLRAPGVITGGQAWFAADDGPAVDLMAADAHQLRKLRWSEISVVFQSAMHALNPVMRIGRQLSDVIRAHRPGLSSSELKQRAVRLLGLVGIDGDRLGSYPHELSGGMRQRVMIAMALALEPKVVIMDEPTTALDVVTQREILEELIGLRDRLGFSVLFITHDLSLLIELADSIAVMYAGRLVERAPARTLFDSPCHPYTYGLRGSFPALSGERSRMTGIPGSPPDLRNVPSGCAFHPRCGYALEQCRHDTPKLLQLAGGTADRSVACWLHDGDRTPPAELTDHPPVVEAGNTVGGVA
jgi:peptide/nickel transport system ATP-binding protein